MFALVMTLTLFVVGVGPVETLELDRKIVHELEGSCLANAEEITRKTIANKAMYGADYIMITQRCEAL